MNPNKKERVKISLTQYEAEIDNDAGLCLGCGAWAYGVEPDARKYECESCGESRVYGLEECLMMGVVE